MNSLFTASLNSKPGGRTYNEDSVQQDFCGQTGCWVLADGLGGHGGGDTASRVACAAAVESFRANPAVSSEALLDHILAADRAVRRQQTLQPPLVSMRTTITVLVCGSHSAIWGHVGDSRLYHIRAGRIHAQTKDHSLPQRLVEADEIREADIRHHADRNRLLRVLGEDNAAQPSVLTEPIRLYAGDAFLLCTDGFWENVFEIEMELDFAKSRDPAQWLELMELRLEERVNGSHDNYSAIAVIGDRLPGFPPPPLSGAVTPSAGRSPVKSGRTLPFVVAAMLPVLMALSAATFAPHAWKARFNELGSFVRKMTERFPLVHASPGNAPRPGTKPGANVPSGQRKNTVAGDP